MRYVRFWDCAAKATERHDYTAAPLCGFSPEDDLYIRGMVRGRWEYPEMKRMIIQTAKTDGKSVVIGIEDTSSGMIVIQDLKRDPEMHGYIIKALPVKADLVIRSSPWADLAAGRKVYLVRGEWNYDFLDEVIVFPGGAHDDQIAGVTGAYELMMANPGLGKPASWVCEMPADYVYGVAPKHCLPR
jgi:predicted phage terminase large subunit-like protein